MIKSFLQIGACFAAHLLFAYGQAPPWQWARTSGGYFSNEANFIAVDSTTGDVFLTASIIFRTPCRLQLRN